uniref:Uncharacterized protein n=1 Tax=Fibrocapsa japonica TaxID=94617 RepID=A0A7S2XYN1_9STRA
MEKVCARILRVHVPQESGKPAKVAISAVLEIVARTRVATKCVSLALPMEVAVRTTMIAVPLTVLIRGMGKACARILPILAPGQSETPAMAALSVVLANVTKEAASVLNALRMGLDVRRILSAVLISVSSRVMVRVCARTLWQAVFCQGKAAQQAFSAAQRTAMQMTMVLRSALIPSCMEKKLDCL